jgi:N-acetylglutamate synthase-like GNAT family acetyltransferase
MEFRIRLATLNDAQEIARLSGQLGYRSTSQEIEARLEVLLHDLSYCTLVAESDVGLLGWIATEKRITLESGIKYEIAGLVVDSAVRRSGTGHALVQAAQKWAIQQGARHMQVRSNIARQESHLFYQALGYKKTKTQHVYVNDLGSA